MPEDKRRKNKQQIWSQDGIEIAQKKGRTRSGNEDENEDEDDIINKLTSAIQTQNQATHSNLFWELFGQNKCLNVCVCLSVSLCLCMVGGPSLIVNQKLRGLLNTHNFWVSELVALILFMFKL